MRRWKGDGKKTHGKLNFVKAGSIIGYGGNTGKYTTGSHLHFELRQKVNNVWKRIDPILHFDDEIIYQRYYGIAGSDFYFRGNKITRNEANIILNS